MPKEPWNKSTVQPAFDRTLQEAIKKPALKASLLDPDPAKVKVAFSDFANIEVPPEITIRFHPEEDLPSNLAVAIPAPVGHTATVPGEPREPIFKKCLLGFYNTYLQEPESKAVDEVSKAKEMKNPSPSKAGY